MHLGDRYSVGSAEVIVTQPRLPCYKLGVKFESDDMVKRFLASGRMGFYVAVTREGEVGVGDEFKVIARDPNAVPGYGESCGCISRNGTGTDDLEFVRARVESCGLARELEGILP